MAIKYNTDLVLNHKFDPKTCRHSINGQVSVLHCHHYMSLYTQLANDCSMIDAKKMLADVAEDSFYEALSSYYKEHNITDIAERIKIAEQYYGVCGLGQMKVTYMGDYSGSVELTHSHVDEGWIAKWGKTDKPINFVTAGYVAALFAAVNDKQPRSFTVKESQSIATGAEYSKFDVVAN